MEDSELLKGTKGEQINFAANLIFTLCTFQSLVKQFERYIRQRFMNGIDAHVLIRQSLIASENQNLKLAIIC